MENLKAPIIACIVSAVAGAALMSHVAYGWTAHLPESEIKRAQIIAHACSATSYCTADEVEGALKRRPINTETQPVEKK